MLIAALAAAGMLTADSAAVCSRPQLPFRIDETVWQALEGSEFYRTLPPAKTVRRTTVNTTTNPFAEPAARTLVYSEEAVSEPLTPCLRHKTVRLKVTQPDGATVMTKQGEVWGVPANLITLGFRDDGKAMARLTGLTITGALFPLAKGNTVSIQMQFEAPAGTFTIDKRCQVFGAAEASRHGAQLTGRVWDMVCTVKTTVGDHEDTANGVTVAWLEDQGVFLNDIAQENSAGRLYIPVVSERDMSALLDNKERVWTTYQWTVE